MNTPRPGTPASRSERLGLAVACTGLLFEGMSLSSINVLVAFIQRSLGLSGVALQFVAGAFAASYAGLLLIAGSAADHWGRLRMFRLGTAVFSLASLGAALAPDGGLLIAARMLQGAGAAFTAPAAFALILHRFREPGRRDWALRILSATGAVGFTAGLVVVGVIAETLGWRWSFAAFAPLGLLVSALAPRVLEESFGHRMPALAWRSALTAVGALYAGEYTLSTVGAGAPAETACAAAATAALLLGFFASERRGPVRLVPADVAANRSLWACGAALGGVFAAVAGAMYVVSLDLVEQRGYSVLATGFAFVPQGVAVAVVSPAAARLTGRRPAAGQVAAGTLVVVLGILLYTGTARGSYALHLLPAGLLVGTGIAVCYPAAALWTAATTSPDKQATASGVLTTCQQAGSALGIATAAAVHGGSARLWVCFCWAAATAALFPVLAFGGRRPSRSSRSDRSGRLAAQTQPEPAAQDGAAAYRSVCVPAPAPEDPTPTS